MDPNIILNSITSFQDNINTFAASIKNLDIDKIPTYELVIQHHYKEIIYHLANIQNHLTEIEKRSVDFFKNTKIQNASKSNDSNNPPVATKDINTVKKAIKTEETAFPFNATNDKIDAIVLHNLNTLKKHKDERSIGRSTSKLETLSTNKTQTFNQDSMHDSARKWVKQFSSKIREKPELPPKPTFRSTGNLLEDEEPRRRSLQHGYKSEENLLSAPMMKVFEFENDLIHYTPQSNLDKARDLSKSEENCNLNRGLSLKLNKDSLDKPRVINVMLKSPIQEDVRFNPTF